MPRLRANGIDIEYQASGDPNALPLLLVTGLGAQLISWDDAFCDQLAGRGFYVIRFDNRDSGLSTRMEEAGLPDVMSAFAGKPNPAYTLDDLAGDAVGVLDGLGIGAAHVVGVSMGGFIAQLMAINHPDRVLSLTSIMSGPSWPESVAPTPDATAVLMATPQSTREGRIEAAMSGRRALRGSRDKFDEAFERARAARAIDRADYAIGAGRQLVAILAADPRLERLKNVRIPTLVIHGVDDPLVPVENGRLVAAAVPGARLMEIEGMGHDVPARVWPEVLDAIAETARKANVLQS